MVSILYLEDHPIDFDLAVSLLRAARLECRAKRVEHEEEFQSALEAGGFDLILADYSLPRFDGKTALTMAQAQCPEIPFVFVSGAIGEEVAIDSLVCGATDYVLKQRLGRLAPAVKRALAEAEEKRARKNAERELAELLVSEQAARADAEMRARELAQANAELEQFAYAASHDLQEPLRTVRLYAEMLVRRYQGSLDKDGVTFLSFIEQGVVRMEKLIRDLLTYSRVMHDVDGNLEVVDLGPVVEQVVSECRQLVEESKATITIGAMPQVRGNRERLARVFQNLFSNSLKYRSSEPRVHVAAEWQDGEWLISVSDNGIGFDQEHAKLIFGLFKRLHRDEYPGTGVGLALSKQIVEQHGGRIWAEGKLGEGARFCFTLPAAAA